MFPILLNGSKRELEGGIISEDGDYIYHTFISSGSLIVPDNYVVRDADYLIVGGGGGGGGTVGGGGGAGGYLSGVTDIFGGLNPIAVGAGGAGHGGRNYGSAGSFSAAFGISASGGGGGAPDDYSGKNGASGGGGSDSWTTGGVGTSGQGRNGGGTGVCEEDDGKQYRTCYGDGCGGGGGGGAGGDGAFADYTSSRNESGHKGGPGKIWVNGVRYAGGGSGGYKESATLCPGGLGGGGIGGGSAAGIGNGDPNTGGGGGGGGGANNWAGVGQNGGSGVVIMRYLKRNLERI
ncbi:MAG: hypothetical protein HOF31_08625 [Gammaproteobacteria bacterium]|nr:hypothetical protein [Gammaproteobacteria bacterium]